MYAQSPKSTKLDRHLSLGARAATVGTVGVAREFELLLRRELQDFLEALANLHEDLASLLGRTTLTASHIAIAATGDALANCAGPDTDTEECLADVDNHTHDLAILLFLKGLADRAQHGVQPELVNVDVALFFEAVRPLAAVLVLDVLPFGTDVLLEKVVIRLESEFRNGGNVVLHNMSAQLEKDLGTQKLT